LYYSTTLSSQYSKISSILTSYPADSIYSKT